MQWREQGRLWEEIPADGGGKWILLRGGVEEWSYKDTSFTMNKMGRD